MEDVSPIELGRLRRAARARDRAERKSGLLARAPGLDWYALVVPPQREVLTQEILDRLGFATFVPVERRWRRRNKFAKAKELIAYALAPRYVFLGLEPGDTPWWDLGQVHLVTGVVGHEGVPAEIPKQPMLDVIRSYANGLNAPTAERWMRTRREFRVGDQVEVVGGPLAGLRVEVVEISGSKAKVLLQLFGSVQNVWSPLDNLEAA